MRRIRARGVGLVVGGANGGTECPVVLAQMDDRGCQMADSWLILCCVEMKKPILMTQEKNTRTSTV